MIIVKMTIVNSFSVLLLNDDLRLSLLIVISPRNRGWVAEMLQFAALNLSDLSASSI